MRRLHRREGLTGPIPDYRTPVPALLTRSELARKALHLSSAVVPVAYATGLPRRPLLAALGALLALAFAVELARARSATARQMFHRVTHPLLREHEHEALAGATWMLVAFAGAVLLFPRDAAVAAMWAVAVGDAMAAVVGKWLGRHRIGRSPKTYEGALACAAATAAGALVLAHQGVLASLAAGTAAALAELPARPLDDNVRVALVVGAVIVLVHIVFY